ncbi:MAG TPA: ParB/RepB/Spo0J family partition protein [Verrucomicrobiae bacterium]
MNHNTNESTKVEVVEIKIDEIKYFVRRSRAQGAYARLKESISAVGLKQPIQVRDITKWSHSDRRRNDGGLYNYELICGQGRLQAFRELELPKIPAMIIDVPEEEIVGRFLAENVMRKRLSWFERAQLVKQDIERGIGVEEIKKKYFVTTGHVYKYLRTLGHASSKLMKEGEIQKLSMNDAEALASLDAKDQEIVVEVLKEENLGSDQIRALVKKTKDLRQTGNLSKNTLRSSLRDLDKALSEARTLLKLRRLHWALGPSNLKQLLVMPEMKLALKKEGVDFSEFAQVIQTMEAR